MTEACLQVLEPREDRRGEEVAEVLARTIPTSAVIGLLEDLSSRCDVRCLV